MINRLRDNFTQVDNKVLNNPKLSLKAKGLYGYLCSKPDTRTFSYKGMMSQLPEGERSIRSAVKELVDAQVLIRYAKRKKDNSGFDGWERIVNPTQSDLETYKDPSYTKPELYETSTSQNRQEISNNKLSNNNISNNKIIDTLQKDLEGDASFLVFDSSTQYEYVDRLLYEHGVVYEKLNTKNFPTKVYKICEMIDRVALEYNIKTAKNSRTINKFGYLMFGKNMDLQEIVDLVEEQSECEFEDIEGLIYSCKGFQFEDY